MNIVFVTPEMMPFSRAGGLADVCYHLSMTLADMGHDLTVITPKHRRAAGQERYPETDWGEVKLSLAGRERAARFEVAELKPNHRTILVACEDLYDRPGLYGNEFGDYDDNAERFIFLCRAAMEVLYRLETQPDVVHCHDWPTGLVPMYIKTNYANNPRLDQAATVMTFHNLWNQGLFWHYDFTMTALNWEEFTPEGLEFHGQMNLLKAGLVSADLITTVSRKYAQEATQACCAFGLEGLIQARFNDIVPVLNGVDYNLWDPATDQFLAANYSADDPGPKNICRQALRKTFDLWNPDWPIVAVISRLLDRKGLDLISAAMKHILEMPLNMVFMGQGDDNYQMFLAELAEQRPGQVGVKIAHEPALAHRTMAGADIFLMPSRCEPCGLEQMYALKYGTVPVVRATGGLDDTVIDALEFPERGNGFKFQAYQAEQMLAALQAAVYNHNDQPFWLNLMKRGMISNFSWELAAYEYEKVYQAARQKKEAARNAR